MAELQDLDVSGGHELSDVLSYCPGQAGSAQSLL
jgi:hypothetical protein